MDKRIYPLACAIAGTETFVTAFHFGPAQAERHVYIQASLHADELPGSLAAYHLCQQLQVLESAGQLRARITVVPLCNPIGLRQSVLYGHVGRFDLATGQNFNRLRTVPLYQGVVDELERGPMTWSAHEADNRRTIRAAMRKVVHAFEPHTTVEALHAVLLRLSCDADVVLDLHCDNHSTLHLYTLPQLWPQLEPLARYLQSECQMLTEDSQSQSFDEMLSTPWLKLQRRYPEAAIALACHTATVELRGERDLSHALASHDAQAIVQYLHAVGDVALAADAVHAMPALVRPPHPLSGLVYVTAPMAGIVVYHVKPGAWVQTGQLLAEVIDPLGQRSVPVHSPVEGVMFTTSDQRFVRPENKLLTISSPHDVGHVGLSP